MRKDWQSNPQLKQMNPENIDFLSTYAERLSNTPKNLLMTVFLEMQDEARKKNIQFSDQETALMMHVLGADMNPEEQKRLETVTAIMRKRRLRKV